MDESRHTNPSKVIVFLLVRFSSALLLNRSITTMKAVMLYAFEISACKEDRSYE